MKRYPRILFFIKGVMPSAEAAEIANEYGPNIAFRNANYVPDSGAIERCDGVAGEVPELYKKCPSVEEAFEKFEKENAEAAKRAAAAKNKRDDMKAKEKEKADAKEKENAKMKAEAEAMAKLKVEAANKAKAETAADAKAQRTAAAAKQKPSGWTPNA